MRVRKTRGESRENIYNNFNINVLHNTLSLTD